MPRGIYDRSKMKNPTEKTAKPAKAPKAPKAEKSAAAPKGKRGRKPRVDATVGTAKPAVDGSTDNIRLMVEARENVKILTDLVGVFGKTDSLTDEISAHLEILSDLRTKVFPAIEVAVEAKAEEPKAAPAVAPPNGAYTSSVPLPPPPVQVPTITQ